jgi:glucans biosynthesis protein C
MVNQTDRQYYFDWLRVIAIVMVILAHSGDPFTSHNWIMMNNQSNSAITALNNLISVVAMPLFFLLSGASSWFALKNNNPRKYLFERVTRLLVPLVFGVLIINPPQVYAIRLWEGSYTGSFWSWYPHFFQGLFPSGNFGWLHLWFLAYLFIFSLLLIPIFHYLRDEKRKPLIDRIASFLEKPGVIYLPIIPLIAVNLPLRPIFGWSVDTFNLANMSVDIIIFFCGFMLVSSEKIIAALQRQKYVSLVAAAFFGVLLVYTYIRGNVPQVITDGLYPIVCWLILMTFIAFSQKSMNFTNSVLRYSVDTVMPVYILHQTIIVVSCFWILKWNVGILPKYITLFVIAVAGSVLVSEIVRRTKVTRFLFGIKQHKSQN